MTGVGERETLLALAERCEQAGGPDRELDEAILLAIGGKKKMSDWWIGFAYIGRQVPAYTASLDAAMTLVPERCGWRLWIPAGSQRDDADLPRVTVWGPARTYAPNDTEATTAALALTAAALKARAQAILLTDQGEASDG